MLRHLHIATALLFMGLLAACGGGASTQTGAAAAGLNFKLMITDAPFPADLVESASIVIREVRVRDVDGSGWVSVFDGSSTIDLVPLTGGVSALLAEIDLAPGTYDEVRLIVDAGEVVLESSAFVSGGSHIFNEANGGLHFPSGAQTGVKVKLDEPIVVVTELSSELTLDFDLSKNFVFNGPSSHAPGVNRIIFTPVVRAVNSTTAGSLGAELVSDNATPGDTSDDFLLSGATVRALDAGGVEAGSGIADDLGRIVIQLPAGTYTLEIEAEHHETTTSASGQVYLGNRTELGSVIIAATGGEVTGTVMSDGATDVNDTDNVVVAGATVEATLQGDATPTATATTDAQGAFRFESLSAGTYDLVVSMAGYADFTEVDVVPTLGGTGVFALLVADTRNLTGTITDSDDAGLDSATVVLVNAAGIQIGSTTTASDGTYALSVPTGAHQVTLSDPTSGATVTQALDVVGTDPETDQPLDVKLDTAGA